ncbi:hypothetical protein GGR57DRAFT_515450 [Xylariaceae sp. FL1272]|nr:hypothetical protein GGR57DRAFT_515450 [Xylariaceae sp. FL1272]
MSTLRSEPPYDEGLQSIDHSTLEYVPENSLEHIEKPTDLPYNNFPYNTNAGVNQNLGANASKWRTVWGIPLSTFVLAIALAVVVVAAAVGGGVGGSLAVTNAKELCNKTPNASATLAPTPTPVPSSTFTTTFSAVYTVETNVLLPLDCPGLDYTPQSSTFAHRTSKFEMYCNTEYNYDSDKAILSIIVYTLHDCLQACVSFNHYVNSDTCTAVEFFANMTSEVPGHEANCFMATDTGTSDLKTSDQGSYAVAGLII